jgi:hypothetical protein
MFPERSAYLGPRVSTICLIGVIYPFCFHKKEFCIAKVEKHKKSVEVLMYSKKISIFKNE